jgi:hypothetical protein
VPSIEIVTDQWPACFIKIDGEPTLADFEGYIAAFHGLYERDERFCIVSHIKRYKTNGEIIARVGRWFQQTEPLIKKYWSSNAMVSHSPGFRFVLSAVYLIKPLPVPNCVCSTPDEALAFTHKSWRGAAPLPMLRWPFDPVRRPEQTQAETRK